MAVAAPNKVSLGPAASPPGLADVLAPETAQTGVIEAV